MAHDLRRSFLHDSRILGSWFSHHLLSPAIVIIHVWKPGSKYKTTHLQVTISPFNPQSHQQEVEEGLDTAVKENEENKFYVKARRCSYEVKICFQDVFLVLEEW